MGICVFVYVPYMQHAGTYYKVILWQHIFREMHVFKALKKHFLITFARNRTFLSISNTALAENLLRQVSNFTLEILDHQYWAPILTHDRKRPQIVAPANQQVCFAFMVWVMWLAAVKGFVCVCFPSHSWKKGRVLFVQMVAWCAEGGFGTLQGHRWFSALMSTISSSPPLTLWPIIPTCSFPCTNYPRNLIMWCQLKHWLSCQATTGQFLIKRFLDNPI